MPRDGTIWIRIRRGLSGPPLPAPGGTLLFLRALARDWGHGCNKTTPPHGPIRIRRVVMVINGQTIFTTCQQIGFPDSCGQCGLLKSPQSSCQPPGKVFLNSLWSRTT